MDQQDAYRCPLRSEEQASLLLDYCARKLDGERRLALDRHARICPDCARFLSSQSAVWKALDEWDSSPVALQFDEDLARRIAENGRTPLWMRAAAWFAEVSWTPAVPALAAAALWLLLFQPAPLPPSGSAQETLEAEQVERVLEDLDMLRQLPL